ncbi:MAG: alpha/beta hydrolase [Patescibacteria group bacterium]
MHQTTTSNHKQKILILHGWGGSSATWQNCTALFDKTKYELFVPDLPGFGSTAAPDKPWNVQDYADYVQKLMKEKNLEKPICICHSFGGRIAIKLASQHPHIFAELFLVAAAGIKHPPSLKIRLFRYISKTGKWILNFLKLEKLADKAKKLIYRAAHAKDYMKAEGTMKETFQNVINEDLSHHLPDIKVKTHIIWGDLDSYVPVKDAFTMHQKIHGSTIDVFPGGTHGLHLRMPEKLVELIEKYLSAKA